MTKVLSFVKLDFITVKTYLKSIILFAGLIFLTASNIPTSFYVLFMSMIYISHPFAVGEQSIMDVLYCTLPIDRKTVVLGRYVYAMVINITSCVLVYFLSLVSAVAFKITFDSKGALLAMGIILMACIIIQSIQLPLYFKLGYAKTRFLAFLPFLIPITVVIVLNSLSFIDITEFRLNLMQQIDNNRALTGIIAIAVTLLSLVISYRISANIYKKREF